MCVRYAFRKKKNKSLAVYAQHPTTGSSLFLLIYSFIWHENQQYARFMYFSHIYKTKHFFSFLLVPFTPMMQSLLTHSPLVPMRTQGARANWREKKCTTTHFFTIRYTIQAMHCKILYYYYNFHLCVWILDRMLRRM